VNEFHIYVVYLRKKHFKNTDKFCKVLGVDRNMWRKIERGINPPPRRSLLKKFCNLVFALTYEETQLYELARRWKPHKDTNTFNHLLSHKGMSSDWSQAIMDQNRPDYEHKHWGKK